MNSKLLRSPSLTEMHPDANIADETRTESSDNTLLSVENLSVSFMTGRGVVKAVSDVSFKLGHGEILGVVGESGCGKSTLCAALVNNLPGNVKTSGSISFKGKDIFSLSASDLKALRGRDIATVLQNPMTAMDPLFTVGSQIDEILLENSPLSRSERHQLAIDMLSRVHIPSPKERLASYPHQMSGGMKQRALIASATALRPSLLLADEPTTALDVTVQEQILNLLGEIRNSQRTSIILITHDLGIVRRLTDKVLIMYAGHIVESGETESVFCNPEHPYTQALIDSIPRIGQKKQRLVSIEGSLPDMTKPPAGCAFASRCTKVVDRCQMELPPLIDKASGRSVRCWLSQEEQLAGPTA